jgi:hypothetical protein
MGPDGSADEYPSLPGHHHDLGQVCRTNPSGFATANPAMRM